MPQCLTSLVVLGLPVGEAPIAGLAVLEAAGYTQGGAPSPSCVGSRAPENQAELQFLIRASGRITEAPSSGMQEHHKFPVETGNDEPLGDGPDLARWPLTTSHAA